MLEKLHQPLLVEIVEETFDVGVEDVVHFALHYRLVDEPHDVMSTALRAKSIRAVCKPPYCVKGFSFIKSRLFNLAVLNE